MSRLISSTRATCSAARLAPSWIWWRQEVPSATISVSAARFPHRRQQGQLAHLERDVDGVGVVAERAGHAAAARIRPSRPKARAPPSSTLSTAPMAAKDFWWQWPCSSAFFGKGSSGRSSVPAFARGRGIPPAAARWRSSARPPSPFIKAGNSSRKVNRQLGSRPSTGMPARHKAPARQACAAFRGAPRRSARPRGRCGRSRADARRRPPAAPHARDSRRR